MGNKFSNELVSWTSREMPINWHEIANDVLRPLVETGLITVSRVISKYEALRIQFSELDAHVIEIDPFGKGRGSVDDQGREVWPVIVCLAAISHRLPQMVVVDENSNIVDRYYLRQHWNRFCDNRDSFEDAASKVGIMPGKEVFQNNPALADFF